jgi:glycosyltransferase involved in cell wall biosynthesis
MRIAFVVDNYPPDLGGIEVVVSELAERMSLAGHEVHVFAHASARAARGATVRNGVAVRRFSVPIPSRTFRISPALLGALARNRRAFDVVHAHNFHAFPSMSAALAGMAPLVFSPHYHGVGHSMAARVAHVPYRRMSRLIFHAAGGIVCGSNTEAEALVADFPRLRTPITIVPHGTDIQGFNVAQPYPKDGDVVLAAGRMVPYKQFDRVVLAASSLPESSEVVLLGDGPFRPQLQELIALNGLQTRVHSVGHVSDDELRRWFRTAAVLVTMSRHESFSLTITEALAAGAPVVASDIPAHREKAESYPSGAVRLVPVDADSPELAAAVTRAIDEGLPSGVQVDTWDKAMERLLDLYRSLI